MKVVVTSTGYDLDAPPTEVFGRCPRFLFVDTDSGDVTAVENPGASADRGAGVQAAQVVVDGGAEAVLTGRVGPRAMEVLERAGVRVHELGGADPRTAIEKLRHGESPP